MSTPRPSCAARAYVRALSIAALVAALAAAPSTCAPETYERVVIGQDGQLRIVTSDQREIVPPKDEDQVGFSEAAVSPDRQAVGWLALYPNCCTSYPIPLKLVVYAGGKVHTFRGTELPVWAWRWEAEGKQVAFRQETVHGGFGLHFELREVETGRLVGAYEPGAAGEPPSWIGSLGR